MDSRLVATFALLAASLAAPAHAAPSPDAGFYESGVRRFESTVRADLSFEAAAAHRDGGVVVLQRRRASGPEVVRLRRFRSDGTEVAGWGGSFHAAERATRWHLRAVPAGGWLAYGTVDSGYRTVTSHVAAVARFDAQGALDTRFGEGGHLPSLRQRPLSADDSPISEPLPVLGAWVQPAGDGIATLARVDGPTPAAPQGFVVRLLDATGAAVPGFGGVSGDAPVRPSRRVLTDAWPIGLAVRADGRILVGLCGRRSGRTAGAVLQLTTAGVPDGRFGSGGYARSQACGVPFARVNGTVLVASGLGHELLDERGRSLRMRGASGYAGLSGHSCATCPTALSFASGRLVVGRRRFGVVQAGSGADARVLPGPASVEVVDARGRSAVGRPFSPLPPGAEADPFGGATYELLGIARAPGGRTWVAGWYRDPDGGRRRAWLARLSG